MFKKNKLSHVIMAMATAAGSHQLMAQNSSEALEEVTVTGIRASLDRAMDVKRDSSGVVDAISAEDIGKFPDTNLAESLQRITGVSIDRVNGEGSQVTIRGFGPGLNMVTLNSRAMPGGSAGGVGAFRRGGNSRAFDFANLASESVSSVQVYKTSKADIASGGLGGTVNIRTVKPLDDPGFKLSIGAKAVSDTTNENGDDITPEFSGIFSWTDDSERFGAALSASVQERHSGAAGAAINDWNIGRWGEDELYSFTEDAVIENGPDQGQLYVRPNDLRYAWADRERERTNAQLTLQFRPVDNLTITGDYTFAENDLTEFRSEQTLWMQNSTSIDHVIFDDNTVATPLFVSETNLANKDMGFEQQWREQEDTLESAGFNVEWSVNDAFTLALDAHDSSMESLPAGLGDTGSIAIPIGAPVGIGQTWDFSGDLPGANFIFNDGQQLDPQTGEPVFNNGEPVFNGNNNGVFDAGDFGSQVANIGYTSQETDITQIRLDGSLEFDNGRFDFGIESRDSETRTRASNRQFTMGNWGVNDVGVDGLAELIELFSLTDQFDDFNPSGDATNLGVRTTDPVALCNWAASTYPSPQGSPNQGACRRLDTFDSDDTVEEEILSAYFQVGLDSALGGFPVHYLTGVRFETTDSTSTSQLQLPDFLLWQDNNDFSLIRTDRTVNLEFSNSYDNLLPSFDFSIDLREDLKARFSASKTIARAGLGSLAATSSGWGAGGGSTTNGATPTANAANPFLEPFESDNLDLSLEWYYGDSSYVSLGFYEKRVDNFIGNSKVNFVNTDFFGEEGAGLLLDVTGGLRADEAVAELADRGIPLDDTTLFSMMVVLENQNNPDVVWPEVCGDDVAANVGNTACSAAIGSLKDINDIDVDLGPNADDPVTVFETTQPNNQESAKIHGFEFALQHFFGDSGFGVQANYTTVRGDVGFDTNADPSEDQFALPGLSDTANLVGIYDNHGFQVRLAYNWRDDFLISTTQGLTDARFVEDHQQWDLNVSYEVNDNLNVFFEGINLTEEDERQYSRNTRQMWSLEDLGARYQLGARYNF